MPTPKGTRFRVKTTKSGGKIRLAFKKGSNQVIEAKNLKTGATHTPKEFASDRKKTKKRGKKLPKKAKKK